MRISEERRMKLYKAISDDITDLRIDILKGMGLSAEGMDDYLFKMEQEIWKKVYKALNLEEPV